MKRSTQFLRRLSCLALALALGLTFSLPTPLSLPVSALEADSTAVQQEHATPETAPEPSAAPTPSATPEVTQSPEPSASPEATKTPKDDKELHGSKLVVASDTGFYMEFGGNYYYVAVNLADNTATAYPATKEQAESGSGWDSTQPQSAKSVDAKLTVNEKRDGIMNTLFSEITIAGTAHWDSCGKDGCREYKCGDNEDTGKCPYYTDAEYTFLLNLEISFDELGSVTADYNRTVTYDKDDCAQKNNIGARLCGSGIYPCIPPVEHSPVPTPSSEPSTDKTDLTIVEKVEGTDSTDAVFHVQMVLPEGQNYPCTVHNSADNSDEALSVQNGQTLDLTADQVATVQGVPVDSRYTLTEVDEPARYMLTGQENTDGTLKNATTAVLTNTYHEFTTLTIRKIVEGTGDDTEFFGILVHFEQEGTVPYTVYDQNNQPIFSGTLASGDTVYLRAREYARLSNLQVGTEFKLEEPHVPADYILAEERNTEGTLMGPVTATFYNHYRVRDSLIIRKQVTGTTDTSTWFYIALNFSQTGNLPYIIYNADGTVALRGAIYSGGMLVLRAGQYAAVAGIRTGMTYTVTEPDPPAGYVLDGITNASGTVTGAVVVTVYNRFAAAATSLTLRKQVTGTEDTATPFTLRAVFNQTGSVPYTLYNADGSVAGTGSVASGGNITLKAGQYATLTGLAMGTQYSITEPTLPDGYELASTTNAAGTLKEAVTATFVNHFISTNSLTIRKRVEGTSADNIPFGIHVSFEQKGTVPYTLYNADGTVAGQGTVASGAVLNLKAGQYAVLTGLRQGTRYALTEPENPAGYTLSSTQNATGTLDADTTAVFVNRYQAAAGYTLTGRKIFASGDGSTLKAGQFTFISTRQQQGDSQTTQNAANGSFAFVYHYTEKDAGKTYLYDISEQQKTDALDYDTAVYQLQVAVTDNGDGTLTLTPTLTKNGQPAQTAEFRNGYQTVNLTVHKVWDDKGHESHRPDRLTYTLIATVKGSSKEMSKAVVSAKNWDYTWTDLPRYDAAHNEISYSVKESDPGSRYTASASAGAKQPRTKDGIPVGYKQTLTLTNRYHHSDSKDEDKKTTTTVTTVCTPMPVAAACARTTVNRVQTGDTAPAQLAISAGLFAAAVVSLAVMKKKK